MLTRLLVCAGLGAAMAPGAASAATTHELVFEGFVTSVVDQENYFDDAIANNNPVQGRFLYDFDLAALDRCSAVTHTCRSGADFIDSRIEILSDDGMLHVFGDIPAHFGLFDFQIPLTSDGHRLLTTDQLATRDVEGDVISNHYYQLSFEDLTSPSLFGAAPLPQVPEPFSYLFQVGDRSGGLIFRDDLSIAGTSRIGFQITSAEFRPSAVPVPAGVWLLGVALAGLGFMRRRRG